MADDRDTRKPAETGAVQYPRDLLTMAKTIAAHSGETVSEIVADASRDAITRRYRQTIEHAAKRELAAAHAPDAGGEG